MYVLRCKDTQFFSKCKVYVTKSAFYEEKKINLIYLAGTLTNTSLLTNVKIRACSYTDKSVLL